MDLISGFQIQVDQLRPFSRGEVALRSSDPAAAPAVTFNYLTDERDVAQRRGLGRGSPQWSP